MRSRATQVDVTHEGITRVDVVDPSQQDFLGTFLNMLFNPWRSLRLSVVDTGSPARSRSTPLASEASIMAREELRHRLATMGIIKALGIFLLVLAATQRDTAMFLSGVAFLGFGFFFALRLMMVARRDVGS